MIKDSDSVDYKVSSSIMIFMLTQISQQKRRKSIIIHQLNDTLW